MPNNLDKNLKYQIDNLIGEHGYQSVFDAIQSKKSKETVLVIIGNCGLHPVPQILNDAEYYCATQGNLDFSTPETIKYEIEKMTKNLSNKLREKKWRDVYVLPFGHPVFSMYIKMTVYRVLGIDSKEIFHRGEGKYALISLDLRQHITF